MVSLLSRSRGVPDPFSFRGTLSLWCIRVDKNSLLSFSFLSYNVLSSDLAVFVLWKGHTFLLSFWNTTTGRWAIPLSFGPHFFPSVVWLLESNRVVLGQFSSNQGKRQQRYTSMSRYWGYCNHTGNHCTETADQVKTFWFISFGSALALPSPSWFLRTHWRIHQHCRV